MAMTSKTSSREPRELQLRVGLTSKANDALNDLSDAHIQLGRLMVKMRQHSSFCLMDEVRAILTDINNITTRLGREYDSQILAYEALIAFQKECECGPTSPDGVA